MSLLMFNHAFVAPNTFTAINQTPTVNSLPPKHQLKKPIATVCSSTTCKIIKVISIPTKTS